MISMISGFILIYFCLLWIGYIVFLIGSIGGILRKYDINKHNNIIKRILNTNGLPVSVCIPVYNNPKDVIHSIESVLNSDYPNIKILVVNDGSIDNTLENLIKKYQLKPITQSFKHVISCAPIKTIYQSEIYSQLQVIDKEHYLNLSSGADAHNAALNICRTPIVITLDSDTVIGPHAISEMIFCYLTHANCVAVGGNIYIPNHINKFHHPIQKLSLFSPTLGVQIIEYLRSFFYGHEGWSGLGGALCHSGAFTLMATDILIESHGFDRDNYSYDSEIIMRLHHVMRQKKKSYFISYAPSAIAWASQPNSLAGLWEQRDRWQRGLWRSFLKHKGMFLNPQYGKTGMIAYPFYFIFEILGPVIEGCAYIILLWILLFEQFNLEHIMWFVLMAWSYLFFITLSCVLLNFLTYNKYHQKTDILILMYFTCLEVIFYRPFRSICAVFSTIKYIGCRIIGRPC
jgi:biofilm PGA synthesis N-glycosyltransferase PgaC